MKKQWLGGVLAGGTDRPRVAAGEFPGNSPIATAKTMRKITNGRALIAFLRTKASLIQRTPFRPTTVNSAVDLTNPLTSSVEFAAVGPSNHMVTKSPGWKTQSSGAASRWSPRYSSR